MRTTASPPSVSGISLLFPHPVAPTAGRTSLHLCAAPPLPSPAPSICGGGARVQPRRPGSRLHHMRGLPLCRLDLLRRGGMPPGPLPWPTQRGGGAGAGGAPTLRAPPRCDISHMLLATAADPRRQKILPPPTRAVRISRRPTPSRRRDRQIRPSGLRIYRKRPPPCLPARQSACSNRTRTTVPTTVPGGRGNKQRRRLLCAPSSSPSPLPVTLPLRLVPRRAIKSPPRARTRLPPSGGGGSPSVSRPGVASLALLLRPSSSSREPTVSAGCGWGWA